MLGGLIPFLPGEIEFRPGDCIGLLNGCCVGLEGVELSFVFLSFETKSHQILASLKLAM